MSTFVTISKKVTPELISKIKLAPQAKEILSYLMNKYGTGNPIDQNELVLDLNSHQTDGKVLKSGSAGPISRLYEFYRKKGYVENGLIVVDKSKAVNAKDATIALLEQKLEYWKGIVQSLDAEDYDQWLSEEPDGKAPAVSDEDEGEADGVEDPLDEDNQAAADDAT